MPEASTRKPARPAPAGTSVEDYLGPPERRFFSSGYRRVSYRFGEVRIESDDDGAGSLETRVAVTYPADWSRKASADLRPHLSTVDAILLAVMGAETYLVHTYGLTDADRRSIWLRQVRISAASRPDENLEQLPLRTRTLPGAVGVSEPGRSGRGTHQVRTELETTIGGMRVTTELVRPAGRPRSGIEGATLLGGPDDLLGPADTRYYGTGFMRRTHRIHDVRLQPEELSANAVVDFSQVAGEPHPPAGAEGDFQPLPTMVDCFVGSLQLAQILLYELDGIHRGSSNTLWMRQTRLEVDQPRREWRDTLPLTTALRQPQLFTKSGSLWRTAQIVGRLGGVRLRCDVAHQLS